jgi:hypothetical protein
MLVLNKIFHLDDILVLYYKFTHVLDLYFTYFHGELLIIQHIYNLHLIRFYFMLLILNLIYGIRMYISMTIENLNIIN